MKRIYDAEHITQAHLLRALLEQQGVDARVDGEYLQGGIGEIGVAGLIGISVEDHQVDAARRIIADFEREQFSATDIAPDDPEAGHISHPAADSTTGSAAFNPVALAIIGAVVVFILYQLALLIWAR